MCSSGHRGLLSFAKSSGQLSPSSCLLACLQCLAQLLTPSSSTSFAPDLASWTLALLATFSHHWLLCLSALWILAHFPDLSWLTKARAQALLTPLFYLCIASLILFLSRLSNTVPCNSAILGLPLISVPYVCCLFHLFLPPPVASLPIMYPQHTLDFPSCLASAECNPINYPLPKLETTGLSWTPFFLLYPMFSPSGTPSPPSEDLQIQPLLPCS